MCCALYVQGVNIMAFCKEYNAATQDKIGTIIPVEISVFEVRYPSLCSALWCAWSHRHAVPMHTHACMHAN